MRHIVKVLTGNEHGGAANSSEWLIDGIIARNVPSLDFHIVMLCQGAFAQKIASKYANRTTVITLPPPPIIGKGSLISRICRTFLLLLWFLRAFVGLTGVLRHRKLDLIHTTNNYALVVCAIYRLFHSVPLSTHWRCIGGIRNNGYKWLVSHTDSIYCISYRVRDSLPKEWQNKCQVIYDGVDVSYWVKEGEKCHGMLRHYLEVDEQTYLFGTIGTYSGIKCHDLLIECCRLLHERHPKLDFRCVLIGSCPNDACKAYLKSMKEKIHDYGLEKYVVTVFDDEIAKPSLIISDLDAFVGSTWLNGQGEGFGLIYVEALSQGVPVIAISVGAAPEIITPEVGLLSPDNSVEHHVKLLEAMADKETRKRFNRNEIRRRAYCFDISHTIDGVLTQYGVC